MPEVLIASDADHVHAEVEAALSGPDVTFRAVRRGQDVLPTVEASGEPDLAVLDLQIGNMGGMAVALALRLEEDANRLGRVPIIMLLDRSADVFLARRSRADAWFVKPINPIQLRAAAERLFAEAEAWWEAEELRAGGGAVGAAGPATELLDEHAAATVVPDEGDDHVVTVDVEADAG